MADKIVTKHENINSEENAQIKCLKCAINYNFPDDKDDYLAHLFMEHRLVIGDVDDIALLEDYLKYWAKEFTTQPLEEYCTTMYLDQRPDGSYAKNEKYYLLCDILPKDLELRKKLTQTRLELALKRHQYELTDRSFRKECLYCRDVIEGLRADYISHLYDKHFLLVGKPEKLVYVDELLIKLENNMKNFICLYCEKIFRDRTTLKEHMRKKGHKRVNPHNSEYDKYFLENYYRTPAATTPRTNKHKNRKQVINNSNSTTYQSETQNVDFERHFFTREIDDENDSDWSDWNGDEIQEAIKCLYCSELTSCYTKLKNHMLEQHEMNFEAAIEKLNFYQRIKAVNFVRRNICLLRCVGCNLQFDEEEMLLTHMKREKHICFGTQQQWDKPEYFFPYMENDGLLCVLDDNANDEDGDDEVVHIITEDSIAKINKDAEKLSLEGFEF